MQMTSRRNPIVNRAISVFSGQNISYQNNVKYIKILFEFSKSLRYK